MPVESLPKVDGHGHRQDRQVACEGGDTSRRQRLFEIETTRPRWKSMRPATESSAISRPLKGAVVPVGHAVALISRTAKPFKTFVASFTPGDSPFHRPPRQMRNNAVPLQHPHLDISCHPACQGWRQGGITLENVSGSGPRGASPRLMSRRLLPSQKSPHRDGADIIPVMGCAAQLPNDDSFQANDPAFLSHRECDLTKAFEFVKS